MKRSPIKNKPPIVKNASKISLGTRQFKEQINWQTATREERHAFYEKMPQELVDVLAEFKREFDSQVVSIEITITVDRL